MKSLYQYTCLFCLQHADTKNIPAFCVFQAPVGEILKWATIRRLEDEPGAPQRQNSPRKEIAIQQFLEADRRNTIPSAIVVTLDQPGYQLTMLDITHQRSEVALLDILVTEGVQIPGLVIDGQHRLLGIQRFDPSSIVNVVLLLDADDMEKAFQFLVINQKISKVDPNHIRALALHYEKEQLDTRLQTAKLRLDPNLILVGRVNEDEESPFRGIISMPTNTAEQRIVLPAAIEDSIRYVQQRGISSFEDDEILLSFLYAIWNSVKQQWVQLWHKKSRLLSKVGVFCFTQYATNALVFSYDWGRIDLSNPEQVAEEVKVLLTYQEPNFWTAPWQSSGSYDNPSGHQLIVNSLTVIVRNKHAQEEWYKDIELIDVNQLENMAEEE